MEIHRKVKAAVDALDADESDVVVRRIVDGVVAGVLRPWLRRAEIEQVIVDAVRRLPYFLKGISEPTDWDRRALAHAVEAVARLRENATMREVEAAAGEAVDRTVAEFNAQRVAVADADQREELIKWLPFALRGFTKEGQRTALEAVQAAWAALPVGSSREQLTKTRDAALAPFHAALVERHESQRREVEAAQRNQWAALQSLLRPPRTESRPDAAPPKRRLASR